MNIISGTIFCDKLIKSSTGRLGPKLKVFIFLLELNMASAIWIGISCLSLTNVKQKALYFALSGVWLKFKLIFQLVAFSYHYLFFYNILDMKFLKYIFLSLILLHLKASCKHNTFYRYRVLIHF